MLLSILGGTRIPELVVTSFGYDVPRPLSPLQFITGPLLPRKSPPLSNSVYSWLNKSQDVVYISFGSWLGLDADLAHNILQALTPHYRILWALKDVFKEKIFPEPIDEDRVRFLNWAPQTKILEHKSVVVFITHNGISSTQEALYYGKPMLSVPVAPSDQVGNAALVEDIGAGSSKHLCHHQKKFLHNKAFLTKSIN